MEYLGNQNGLPDEARSIFLGPILPDIQRLAELPIVERPAEGPTERSGLVPIDSVFLHYQRAAFVTAYMVAGRRDDESADGVFESVLKGIDADIDDAIRHDQPDVMCRCSIRNFLNNDGNRIKITELSTKLNARINEGRGALVAGGYVAAGTLSQEKLVEELFGDISN